MIITLLASLLLAEPVAAGDTARMSHDTLFVEPVGSVIILPPEWFHDVRESGSTDCAHKIGGSDRDRFVVDAHGLASLAGARGEWTTEYSAVADSIMPLSELVAQVGPRPWLNGCFTAVRMRVYVGDLAPDSVVLRVRGTGLRVARGFFANARAVDAGEDTVPRRRVDAAVRDSTSGVNSSPRLVWDARYFDYGSRATVDVVSARTGGRTLTLLFMQTLPMMGNPVRDREYVLGHLHMVGP